MPVTWQLSSLPLCNRLLWSSALQEKFPPGESGLPWTLPSSHLVVKQWIKIQNAGGGKKKEFQNGGQALVWPPHQTQKLPRLILWAEGSEQNPKIWGTGGYRCPGDGQASQGQAVTFQGTGNHTVLSYHLHLLQSRYRCWYIISSRGPFPDHSRQGLVSVRRNSSPLPGMIQWHPSSCRQGLLRGRTSQARSLQASWAWHMWSHPHAPTSELISSLKWRLGDDAALLHMPFNSFSVEEFHESGLCKPTLSKQAVETVTKGRELALQPMTRPGLVLRCSHSCTHTPASPFP